MASGALRRIVVCIKQVPKAQELQVDPKTQTLKRVGVPSEINPPDANALEMALQLKEKHGCEVVVLSMGPTSFDESLERSIAMGADRAILVQTDAALAPLSVARVFQKIVETEQPFLVMLGKQAIDEDNGQTAQMLAALLDRPQAVSCSKV